MHQGQSFTPLLQPGEFGQRSGLQGDFVCPSRFPQFQNVGWRPQHSNNTGVASLCYQFSGTHLQVCPNHNGLFHDLRKSC
jgi:hypothetical protein